MRGENMGQKRGARERDVTARPPVTREDELAMAPSVWSFLDCRPILTTAKQSNFPGYTWTYDVMSRKFREEREETFRASRFIASSLNSRGGIKICPTSVDVERGTWQRRDLEEKKATVTRLWKDRPNERMTTVYRVIIPRWKCLVKYRCAEINEKSNRARARPYSNIYNSYLVFHE